MTNTSQAQVPLEGTWQPAGRQVHWMAQAVPVLTRTSPLAPSGSGWGAALSQPVVMAMATSGAFRATATLNLEGATIPDGEATFGAWGEGFVDRRHPHTYAHELMLAWTGRVAPLGQGGAVSLAAGKGFVPFGTDDPMVRPLQRYPVNHHLAQILERWTAIAGVRTGAVAVEAALFNGDEPERPGQWPRVARFGDSWAARVTVAPLRGVELQGSHAEVRSPEHRPGAGTDQRKWSASGRLVRPIGPQSQLYALAEWARTTEAGGFFRYGSLLGETSLTRGRVRLAYRFERTDRPEEERLPGAPTRSARPHLDNSILGASRLALHTVRAEWSVRQGRMLAQPFLEATLGAIRPLPDAGVFDAQAFYGRTRVRTVSSGVRLTLGAPMWRMGRYGVVAPVMTDPEHGAH